jgi:hypothetical protein
MRGPAGIASPKASTFITASWGHNSEVTDSERTPLSRMLGERYRRATEASLAHSILYDNKVEPKSIHHLFVRQSFACSGAAARGHRHLSEDGQLPANPTKTTRGDSWDRPL